MQKSSGDRRSFLCEYGYTIWGAARGSVETETLALLRTPKNFWEKGIYGNCRICRKFCLAVYTVKRNLDLCCFISNNHIPFSEVFEDC